ncbi:hypothetical protein DKX38_007532 [Salix brachista]|uniref:Uncharacterized protein n=1 Tax=Salix brachista TaxID=2182728 RepID=A0A5N5MQD3_9ROSI|nr:hypothetical protein DKX38_007532 [Salix brachista]
MDDNNTKLDSGESKNNNSEQEENPNLSSNGEQQEGDGEREGRGGGPQRQTSRTPFTNLSQEDADLALARTLQEQVSFFSFFSIPIFLLKWIYIFGLLGLYNYDEAYARALQEAEEREVAARLLALAGLNGITGEAEEDTEEDHGGNSQVSISVTEYIIFFLGFGLVRILIQQFGSTL